MQTQPTFDSLAALASYAEREIEDAPAGGRLALVSGVASEAVGATLAHKGYAVQRSGAQPWAGIDLVFAAGSSDTLMTPLLLDRVLLALNPDARVILVTPDPSNRLER